MGQGKPPMPDDHSFGVKNMTGDGMWNAAKCIHGEPGEKELGPDRDLGKSVKPGCRNEVRKVEDNNRIFGTPTIRTDIPYKEKRSIADYSVSIHSLYNILELWWWTRSCGSIISIYFPRDGYYRIWFLTTKSKGWN